MERAAAVAIVIALSGCHWVFPFGSGPADGSAETSPRRDRWPLEAAPEGRTLDRASATEALAVDVLTLEAMVKDKGPAPDKGKLDQRPNDLATKESSPVDQVTYPPTCTLSPWGVCSSAVTLKTEVVPVPSTQVQMIVSAWYSNMSAGLEDSTGIQAWSTGKFTQTCGSIVCYYTSGPIKAPPSPPYKLCFKADGCPPTCCTP